MLSTGQVNLHNPSRPLQGPKRVNIRNRSQLIRHITPRSVHNLTPRSKRDHRHQRKPQSLSIMLLTSTNDRHLREYNLITRRTNKTSSLLRINPIHNNRYSQVQVPLRRNQHRLISPLINTLHTRSHNRRRFMHITRVRFTIHIKVSLLRSPIRNSNSTCRHSQKALFRHPEMHTQNIRVPTAIKRQPIQHRPIKKRPLNTAAQSDNRTSQ